jgi:hypothetical protein
MMKTFEQTELTKLILTALKSFQNKGRVHNKAFGNLLQTYAQADVDKIAELVHRIENERLDIRLSTLDY